MNGNQTFYLSIYLSIYYLLLIPLVLSSCQTLPNASLSSHPLDFSILGKRPERAKPDLYPVLDCVQPNRLGTYTAYFSFENSTSKEMRLPVGEKNQFTPALSAEQNRPRHRDRHEYDRDGDFKTHSTKQNHSQDKREDRKSVV